MSAEANVSDQLLRPNGPIKAIAVVAVPPLTNPARQEVIAHITQGLLRVGCAVVKHEPPAALPLEDGLRYDPMKDYRALLDHVVAHVPTRPLWAVGYGEGAYLALHAGAKHRKVQVLLGIATPAETLDFSTMKRSKKPKFLIHGERDEVCTLKGLRRFYGQLSEPRDVAIIDSADHAFDGHASEIADAIEELLGDFDIAAYRNWPHEA